MTARRLNWWLIALFWAGIVGARLLGGPNWCPAWLGLTIFALMFPLHWRPVNRLADRVLGGTHHAR